jgi:hypothetical protein
MQTMVLTAGLSLLLGLTACATKAKEGDQKHEQSSVTQTQPALTTIDWNRVATALGRAGAVQPGGVYKVGMPRSDLHITVGSVQIKPALALGSWVGFKQNGENEVIAMGDLVLLESEVGPVTAKLQQGASNRPRSTITCSTNHLTCCMCTSEGKATPSRSPERSTPR